jgi:hypothetical protein
MKKPLLLLVLSLGMIAAWASNITSQSQGNAPRRPQEEATVQTGDLTEKQKLHSKLYKEYRRDKKIPELLREYSFDIGITIGTSLPGGLPDASQSTYSERITNSICDKQIVSAYRRSRFYLYRLRANRQRDC